MRITFYSESPDPGPGGAEQFIAVLAEALSEAHEVCIVHHKPPEAASLWPRYSGCDLSRVKFRFVPMTVDQSGLNRKPWTRFRAAKNWRREITDDCDFFVGMLHAQPPFCHARRGVLVVLFPTFQPFRPLETALVRPVKKKSKKKKTSPPRDLFSWPWFRRVYARWEWKRRLASYPVRFSISDFSRRWTRERWRIKSGLLYPPVALPPPNETRRVDRILSVGRFATTGHTKKQREMIETFRDLRAELPGWSYACVGGINETPQDQAFFEQVHALADVGEIDVRANLPHAELDHVYRSSRIFWHAAGLGEDDKLQPEQAEHFGLTTVEAMAHGCVPLVINQGGQPEIVEHGVCGFVWNTLDELKGYTRLLAHDRSLLEKFSGAAQLRAQRFSREACLQKFLEATGLTNG